MAVNRPGLTDASGHAAFLTAADAVTTTQVLTIVQEQTTVIKAEVLEELPLPIQTSSYVTSFNGLTGAVEGVSNFNGITGAVAFEVDGGEFTE